MPIFFSTNDTEEEDSAADVLMASSLMATDDSTARADTDKTNEARDNDGASNERKDIHDDNRPGLFDSNNKKAENQSDSWMTTTQKPTSDVPIKMDDNSREWPLTEEGRLMVSNGNTVVSPQHRSDRLRKRGFPQQLDISLRSSGLIIMSTTTTTTASSSSSSKQDHISLKKDGTLDRVPSIRNVVLASSIHRSLSDQWNQFRLDTSEITWWSETAYNSDEESIGAFHTEDIEIEGFF